jgi:hypothetical protein
MTNGILPQQSQTAREMWSMFAGLIDQVAVSRFFDVPRRYWLAMGISDGPEHGKHAAAAVIWRVHVGKFPVDFDIETVWRAVFAKSIPPAISRSLLSFFN